MLIILLPRDRRKRRTQSASDGVCGAGIDSIYNWMKEIQDSALETEQVNNTLHIMYIITSAPPPAPLPLPQLALPLIPHLSFHYLPIAFIPTVSLSAVYLLTVSLPTLFYPSLLSTSSPFPIYSILYILFLPSFAAPLYPSLIQLYSLPLSLPSHPAVHLPLLTPSLPTFTHPAPAPLTLPHSPSLHRYCIVVAGFCGSTTSEASGREEDL